ncbi:MAG: tail fiber domain-containing protein [Planctomycetota bacterium]
MDEQRRGITVDGKTYYPGDEMECEINGVKHKMTVPDVEALTETTKKDFERRQEERAPSEELTDEQLEAVSGGQPPWCGDICSFLNEFFPDLCQSNEFPTWCYCGSLFEWPWWIDTAVYCSHQAGTTSDRRLKHNVRGLDGALNKLLALRGVTFEYLDPKAIGAAEGVHTGFIAQELEDVLPDWVDEHPGHKRITPQGLSFQAITVEAVRELHEKNETLAAENRALEQRLARLEALMRDAAPV